MIILYPWFNRDLKYFELKYSKKDFLFKVISKKYVLTYSSKKFFSQSLSESSFLIVDNSLKLITKYFKSDAVIEDFVITKENGFFMANVSGTSKNIISVRIFPSVYSSEENNAIRIYSAHIKIFPFKKSLLMKKRISYLHLSKDFSGHLFFQDNIPFSIFKIISVYYSRDSKIEKKYDSEALSVIRNLPGDELYHLNIYSTHLTLSNINLSISLTIFSANDDL